MDNFLEFLNVLKHVDYVCRGICYDLASQEYLPRRLSKALAELERFQNAWGDYDKALESALGMQMIELNALLRALRTIATSESYTDVWKEE